MDQADQATDVTDAPATTGTPAGSPAADLDGLLADLTAVDAALTHLDEGTYGRCGACGNPIDDARLAEAPTAARCRACDPGAAPPSP